MKRTRFIRTATAAAVALLSAHVAQADSFEIADGWTGSWSSSVSLGSSWRARDRDSRLYGQANGGLVGLTDGTGANTIDEGNLNYDKGDRYTTLFKLISEVEIKKGEMGMLLRGKAWYDQALKDEKVRFGNQGNGYNGYALSASPSGAPGTLTEQRPLSDSGFDRLNKFSGLYLLDAYAYNTFEVAGQPLQVRAGNQVVNWGESLFIQGLNQINPIDVPSFRKPGAQLKEVFLPVPILQASQSLGDFGGIEAFWQWKWKNTPIEASCGNYWSVAANNISPNAPGACNNAVTLTQSNPYGATVGAYVPGIEGRKAKDAGEFGLAYRFTSDALDTEFGFYGMNIHSRTPVISVQKGGGATASPFSVFWEYPENVKVYGVSAATNLAGWSVAGELSFHRGVPVQVDGNDLLLSSLGAGGALSGTSIPFGPYGNAAVSAFAGNGYLAGYTRANKTQLQLNTVKAGNGVLGASQYLFIAEVGFQFNNLPDYKKDPTALRYNRAFIFGPGASAAYGGSTCNPAAPLNVPGAQGCDNDGYVTKRAVGYRLKGELTYNDLIPGVTVYPGLYWSHDVYGYSLDNQFIQGRMALSPSVRFSYAKKYNLDVGAVRYNRNAKFDPLRDRDSVYVNAGMSF